jgi:hypothetical protein
VPIDEAAKAWSNVPCHHRHTDDEQDTPQNPDFILKIVY